MSATIGSRSGDSGMEKTLGHRVVVSALRSLIVVLGFLSSAADPLAPKRR
jgi:hypothetical protein